VYLTTLAVARPLAGLIAPELAARLAPLLAHHAGLAAPKQLLLMGKAASGAILGADGAARRGSLHRVNLNGSTIDAVAIMPPDALLKQPQGKREAWRGLQLLIGGRP
jgi:DNA polymerase